MNPSVLYEDAHVIAINKPSGLVVHAGVGTAETLVDWLCVQYPEIREVGESSVGGGDVVVFRPGIVHRLDRETSGVMVVAKSQEMFHTLKQHFQKGKVLKEYHAFVYGSPRKERGTVRLAIGTSKRDFRRRSTHSIQGVRREACTDYVLSGSCPEGTSFMRFYPKTGRMHQIRVHAQSLQIPIICDVRYAVGRLPMLGFSRLALHARRITLQTHHYSKPLHITAPYPPDFAHALTLCSQIIVE